MIKSFGIALFGLLIFALNSCDITSFYTVDSIHPANLSGGSLVGFAASMADVALDLLGSVALLDDLASDLFVLGVGR